MKNYKDPDKLNKTVKAYLQTLSEFPPRTEHEQHSAFECLDSLYFQLLNTPGASVDLAGECLILQGKLFTLQ